MKNKLSKIQNEIEAIKYVLAHTRRHQFKDNVYDRKCYFNVLSIADIS